MLEKKQWLVITTGTSNRRSPEENVEAILETPRT